MDRCAGPRATQGLPCSGDPAPVPTCTWASGSCAATLPSLSQTASPGSPRLPCTRETPRVTPGRNGPRCTPFPKGTPASSPQGDAPGGLVKLGLGPGFPSLSSGVGLKVTPPPCSPGSGLGSLALARCGGWGGWWAWLAALLKCLWTEWRRGQQVAKETRPNKHSTPGGGPVAMTSSAHPTPLPRPGCRWGVLGCLCWA